MFSTAILVMDIFLSFFLDSMIWKVVSLSLETVCFFVGFSEEFLGGQRKMFHFYLGWIVWWWYVLVAMAIREWETAGAGANHAEPWGTNSLASTLKCVASITGIPIGMP